MPSMIKQISIDKLNNSAFIWISKQTGNKEDGQNCGLDRTLIPLAIVNQENKNKKEIISDILK